MNRRDGTDQCLISAHFRTLNFRITPKFRHKKSYWPYGALLPRHNYLPLGAVDINNYVSQADVPLEKQICELSTVFCQNGTVLLFMKKDLTLDARGVMRCRCSEFLIMSPFMAILNLIVFGTLRFNKEAETLH